MKDDVETYTYRGCTIHVRNDPGPENPRGAWDHIGTMFCLHNRYNLGDKLGGWRNRVDAETYIRQLANQAVRFKMDADDVPTKHIAAALEKHYLILNLYLYEHSGITIRCSPFSDPWDSGRVGIIHLSLKQAINNWTSGEQKPTDWDSLVDASDGKKHTLREAATKLLEGEVEEYDNYLTGSVYGYEVTDPNDEHVDSCWGFFGYEATKRESWMIKQAFDAIDHWAEKQDTEANERAYWEARDTVTIDA